ncbi:hypothetical protein F4678DRAFT_415428 [Xylaria arbuscula]|nr:hypothetical protein F4678DRAFT_415428 [Xylaria arbuscula]
MARGPCVLLIRVSDMIQVLHNYVVADNLQQTSVGILKVAILLDWIRIFVPAGVRNLFFWTCQVVMWLNILWHISLIITVNLSCIPYNAIWDLTIRGKCFDKKKIDVAAAVFVLTTDVLILILPHKVIWDLHMSVKKKVGVSAVFCLGIFGCVSAAIRLPSALSFSDSQDVLYNYSAVTFWATAEFTSGMIILCGPSTPVLAKRLSQTKAQAWLVSWVGTLAHTSTRSQPHGSSKQSHWPTMYRRVDNNSAVNLKTLITTGSGEQLTAGLSDRAIVRTTHFSAVANHESTDWGQSYELQHPWVGNH